MKHKLGEYYIWKIDHTWEMQSEEIQQAHNGKRCRIMRGALDAEGFMPGRVWWVVFDDGFITIATINELYLPLEVAA